MTVTTALKPSRMAIEGSAEAGPRPRAITSAVSRGECGCSGGGCVVASCELVWLAATESRAAAPRAPIWKTARRMVPAALCLWLATPIGAATVVAVVVVKLARMTASVGGG